jgi:hypothetical protein
MVVSEVVVVTILRTSGVSKISSRENWREERSRTELILRQVRL